MRTFIFCLFSVVTIFIFSCKTKNKKMEVLPFDTMKVVIWDLLNANEWNNTLIIKDSSLIKSKNNLKLFQQVFYIHHTSKEQFYYSYQFYEQHPDKLKALMDTISTYGPRQRFMPSIKPK